jgi:hypothetical protein
MSAVRVHDAQMPFGWRSKGTKIQLVLPYQQGIRAIDVQPGTKAVDAMAELRYSGFLFVAADGRSIDPADDLYAVVEQGQTLNIIVYRPRGFDYGMPVRVNLDAPAELRPGALGYAFRFENVTTKTAVSSGVPVGTLLYTVEFTDGSQELVPANMTVRVPPQLGLPEADAGIIASCFPQSLWADVRRVTTIMPAYRHSPLVVNQNPAGRLVPVKVTIEGEAVNVLNRTYSGEPAGELVASLSTRQRLIYDCVYARHWDGFVRERHVEGLLAGAEPWIPTFVLELLGEYVIEIAQMIDKAADVIPRDAYQRYAVGNPAYLKRICKKIVSYYHYGPAAGSSLDVAPSYAVMSELGLWDRHEGARVLRAAGKKRG